MSGVYRNARPSLLHCIRHARMNGTWGQRYRAVKTAVKIRHHCGLGYFKPQVQEVPA